MIADKELQWLRTRTAKKTYELHADAAVVGLLSFQRGTQAQADIGENQWTFRREGFRRPTITVGLADSGMSVASFRPGRRSSGILELSPVCRLQWCIATTGHRQWVWQTLDQQPLVRFLCRHRWRAGLQASIEIGLDAKNLPEVPLLVALGWYLLLLRARDTAVSAAAIAAGAG